MIFLSLAEKELAAVSTAIRTNMFQNRNQLLLKCQNFKTKM